MPRSAVPKAREAGAERPVNSSTTSPVRPPARDGVARVAPTICSAMSRAAVVLGSQVPTTRPWRRIVALSQIARISSSLWLM